jgi:hypothetical protein|tara:strand:+ start:10863 stop:11090 length:228 start_codon:yes stop_codon:yes gene_type:complete
MCGGGSRPAPQPVAPNPVVNASPIGEQLVPTLETADELSDKKKIKKKAKKSGTEMLQTSGVNTTSATTSSGLNIG